MRDEDGEELTKAATARRLGVGVRQLENYLADGMPCRREGARVRIVWREAFAWFLARREEQSSRRRAPAGAEEAKTRREIAAARSAELELERQEGSLMDRKDVEAWTADLFRVLAARVESVGGKYAPRCLHLETLPEARAVVRAWTDEVLAALQGAALEAAEDDAA